MVYTLRLGNKMVDFHSIPSSNYISVAYYNAGATYNEDGMYSYRKAKATELWNNFVKQGYERIL